MLLYVKVTILRKGNSEKLQSKRNLSANEISKFFYNKDSIKHIFQYYYEF